MAGAAGFDNHGPLLTIGSVFGVRQWSSKEDGLTGVHGMAWSDGENVATCERKHAVPWGGIKADVVAKMTRERDELHAEWQRLSGRYPRGLAGMPAVALAEYERVYGRWQELDSQLKDLDHSSCGCGFWGYWKFDAHEYSMGEKPVVGVIEGYGKCIIGERGFRCEKARIVGLHLAYEYVKPKPSQLNKDVHEPGWHSVFTSDYESGTPDAVARLAADEAALARRYPSAKIYATLDALLEMHPPGKPD